MLIKIIPCLDLKDGRVVKGVRFEDLKDAGSPVEAAERYAAAGADELVLLDITATTDGRRTIVDVVKAVCDKISIPVTVGGGISSLADIERILEAGASKISLNAAAVSNPALITEASVRFGSDSVVVAIDAVRNNQGDYEVTTHGGRQMSGLAVATWAQRVEALGAGAILLTSYDRDGTKSGYDNELNRLVSSRISIPLIASGGAGNLGHFYEAVEQGGASAVLAAGLFHFGEISIPDLKRYLLFRGIEVSASVDDFKISTAWSDLTPDDAGKIPVIVQDYIDHTVLMLAYMNEEAYKQTVSSGLMHYYSRSRQEIWRKGDTSGNKQEVVFAHYDCDADTLLFQVKQTGGACHTGERSCFYRQL